MEQLESLKAELLVVQHQIRAVHQQGRVLTDCWLAKAKPGKGKNKYFRLKSRKRLFNGKKTEYVSSTGKALEEAEAAIARGKIVKKLQKQFDMLLSKIEKLQKKQTHLAVKKSESLTVTPLYPAPELMMLVRAVLGQIDLSPIGDDTSQPWIQASHYYSLAENGLAQPWVGRVWLFPPTNQPTAKWVRRAISEFEAGQISEAMLLVKSAFSSKWFQQLLRQFPVCFPQEAKLFVDQNGQLQPNPDKHYALFYLGPNVSQFKDVFWGLGSVSSPTPIATAS